MTIQQYLGELGSLPGVVRNFLTADRKGIRCSRIPYGSQREQYLLLAEPPAEARKAGYFIFFIHGGGWRLGKPDRYLPLAKLFVQRGYPVVMASHRKVPRYGFHHLQEDAFQAFCKAVSLPGMAGRRACLLGISAGGNLCGLLAYKKALLQQYGLSQQSFACFVSVAGALDLNQFPDTLPLRAYTGPYGGEIFQQANPINFVEGDEQLPLLCIHGTRDAIVPYSSSVSFVSKIKLYGRTESSLHTVEGGTHFHTTTAWWLNPSEETQLIMQWIAAQLA